MFICDYNQRVRASLYQESFVLEAFLVKLNKTKYLKVCYVTFKNVSKNSIKGENYPQNFEKIHFWEIFIGGMLIQHSRLPFMS